jgi:hypothetical protein
MYEQYLCAQQLGGRKKVPVTLGLHEARAFLRNGQQIGHSVGLLMVDLTEAFYRVLRPLAVGGQYSDEQIARIVHKLGMTSDTLHELHEHLRQPSAVDQACLPHHLRQVLRALHTDTYFQIQGQEDCCHTSVGSRPGDCFADVVFSYLFSRVLKSFQQKLDEVGLQQRVAAAPTFDPFGTQDSPAAQVPYLGPVWMDDVCICLTAPTPDGLLRRVGTATSLLLDTMKGYGLTPNLKKGKTELLLSLRGRGVRKCQKQVWEFAQGLLGAISAKPTMLLSLNLPSLGLQIRSWRVVDDLPKVASIGQGNDGKFRTFVLKEYPLPYVAQWPHLLCRH